MESSFQHQSDSNQNSLIEKLQQELHIRNQRSDQLLKEKDLIIKEHENRISELESVIHDQEREILNVNVKFHQVQQTTHVTRQIFLWNIRQSFHFFLQTQQNEFDSYRQKSDLLTVDSNISTEEYKVCRIRSKNIILFFGFQTYLEKINTLEKQLEMAQVRELRMKVIDHNNSCLFI